MSAPGAYGIRQCAPDLPGALTCGTCGRSWNEDITPSGRCPWEYLSSHGKSTSYVAVHTRLRRSRGSASSHPCSVTDCDRPARVWAWTRQGPSRAGEVKGKPVTWGTEEEDYAPMCDRHHRMTDGGGSVDSCPKGHSRDHLDRFGNCLACGREYDHTPARQEAHRLRERDRKRRLRAVIERLR